MGVEIRRGSARFAERAPGRATWHSFSFGSAYDPDNTDFGPIVCHDDHWLGRGEGFPTHHHAGLVIVTWVVTGALTHTGPEGSATVGPGQVAVLHTGAGVEHSEIASSTQTRFVQVWLEPDDAATGPTYDVRDAGLVTGELVEVARPTTTATFSVARLDAGQSVTLPSDPMQHVFVARGALVRSSLAQPLHDGDAFRITLEPGEVPHVVTAAVPTDLLVWGLREG